jgi:hypothetical protein
MKPFIKPITFSEVSHNFVLLHKALAVLELPVSKKELECKKAGPDTRKKVRTLQKQLNIPIDPSTLANRATAAAIADALERRGFIKANRAFTVTGAERCAFRLKSRALDKKPFENLRSFKCHNWAYAKPALLRVLKEMEQRRVSLDQGVQRPQNAPRKKNL